MKQYIQFDGVADISDASDTSQVSMEAPFAGRLYIPGCFVRWTEATGTQTTTQGVVSIEVAGTEVASFTANQSDAVGETQAFSPDGTNVTAASPYAEFSAGDDIEVVVKTQAVDGTVTGDGTAFLAFEFGV